VGLDTATGGEGEMIVLGEIIGPTDLESIFVDVGLQTKMTVAWSALTSQRVGSGCQCSGVKTAYRGARLIRAIGVENGASLILAA
jgi:hypothetical protein